MFENTPNAIWGGRPSIRTSIPILMVAVGVTYWSLVHSGDITADMALWMQETLGVVWSTPRIERAHTIVRIVCLIPVLMALFRIIKILSTRYEVTPDRLLYHHGILVRRHDEIQLRRVRDFRVIRPLVSRLLGLGTIYMVSRDEAWPELKMGPFVDAREVQQIIHNAVVSHQKETGYRELETY